MDGTMVVEKQQLLFIVYVISMFCTVSSFLMVFSLWNCLALFCTWMGYTCILLYSLD